MTAFTIFLQSSDRINFSLWCPFPETICIKIMHFLGLKKRPTFVVMLYADESMHLPRILKKLPPPASS